MRTRDIFFLNRCTIYFICLCVCIQVHLFAENQIVLVTGGAGYIGSHTCHVLDKAGFSPVTYDSLINGDIEAVKWGPLIIGDLHDTEKLDDAFSKYKPTAVIHFAALRNVGESVAQPYEYYHINVAGTLNLLNVMKKHNVKNIIFSSSCTVYGIAQTNPIHEETTKQPINPYAHSKYFVEKILEDFAHAYDFKYVILRYFNAAGVDYKIGLKRSSQSFNFLIPKALQALLDGVELPVFGVDYPTVDGTAIRDYIHVKDLADGHVMALKYLLTTQNNLALNLGTGKGYSVFEILQAIKQVTNTEVPIKIMLKREGDVPESVADQTRAKRILNFVPKYSDLQTIIESEWNAIQNNRQTP
jgi:UDP-arabinose 4-epimerase